MPEPEIRPLFRIAQEIIDAEFPAPDPQSHIGPPELFVVSANALALGPVLSLGALPRSALVQARIAAVCRQTPIATTLRKV